ncbi:acyltransferase family protein [Litorimonas sp. RW-G-Af-16]|uniref:acyltransferase family protein n=1 Tax=Litorimonas sp. RW-G-Af-16 TaxID=3241168 RepID=UPI003AAB633B
MGQTKIQWLNNLRGLAALLVVLHHWGTLFKKAEVQGSTYKIAPDFMFDPAISGNFVQSFYTLIEWIKPYTFIFDIELGAAGVLLFFLISGFVISISVERYHAGEFLVSRVFRLLPTLAFALLLILGIRLALIPTGFIETVGFGVKDFVTNLFLIKDFTWSPSIENAIWTLLVEVKFYALMAGLAYFKRDKLTPGLIMQAALAMLVLGTVFAAANMGNIFPSLFERAVAQDAFYLFSFGKAISDSAGFIVFMLCGVIAYFYAVGRVKLGQYIILSSVLLCFYVILMLCRQYGFEQYYYVPAGTKILIIFTALNIFFVRSLNRRSGDAALTESARRRSRFNIVGFFADISYPLYLIHATFGMTLILYCQHIFNNPNIAFAVAIPIIFGLSWICHKFIERPLAKKGKIFAKRLTSNLAVD